MAIVEVKNQYYFYFDIGGNPDFAEGGGSIVSFVFEEFAGGSLPMFEFVFTTSNFKILSNINEGTQINCSYGKTSDKLDTMSFTVQKFEYTIQSDQFMTITCRGFIGGTAHLTKCEIQGWKSKDSLSVIKEVAGKDYKIKSFAKTPTDVQNWIRYNIPAIRFIQEVWEHSYISDDNFLLYSINRHNEFVITDFKQLTGGKEKWKLDQGSGDANSVAIQSSYRINSNHGLINNIAVYQKERRTHNTESGSNEKVTTPKKSPVLASSSKLNIQSVDPKNYGKSMATNSAMHPNYHKAYYNNSSKIALYGSTEIHVETDSGFLPFEIYDLVKFENIQLDKKTAHDVERLSGLFIITRISRYWSDNTFATSLTISKESLNNLKGSLL